MATTMSFILRPLCISTTSTILSKYPLRKATFSSIKTSPLLFSRSVFCYSLTSHSPTKAFTSTSCLAQEEASEIQEFDVVEASEDENEEENLPRTENIGTGGGVGGAEAAVKLPELTVKEKKELASYAHSLGKKLKLQLVGKSGVTQSLVSAFIENLESNELLKIKIHGTCPGELEDVVKQLEEGTGAVVVGQIGRTVIVYRPSVTKLQAEEKKRQARRIFVRKQSKVKHLLLERLQNKEQGMHLSGRGRRGGSRV
ncbi:hypothetical protein Ddye_003990 [Dipteronia dyeriana]|uniref:CRM domain-containing protein n=1 Tax=Dipteronia dyeriana TaxID=168575 RepID=A0AAD9XTA5_9ROSI|nr:hypothetical protein Ddye_003990 [Dipteronia dyeriana]